MQLQDDAEALERAEEDVGVGLGALQVVAVELDDTGEGLSGLEGLDHAADGFGFKALDVDFEEEAEIGGPGWGEEVVDSDGGDGNFLDAGVGIIG